VEATDASCAWCAAPAVARVTDPYDGADEPACAWHAEVPARTPGRDAAMRAALAAAFGRAAPGWSGPPPAVAE
jgi:hypothetical protein